MNVYMFVSENKKFGSFNLKILIELEIDGDTNSNWCTLNGPQRLAKKVRRVRNHRTNCDHLNNCRILRMVLET